MAYSLPTDKQIFWQLQTAVKPRQFNGTITADVAIVGGGMAGLTAAHSFSKRGYKTVLLEQYYCGAGASGKSSGFITPNSELGLTHYVKTYGPEPAKLLWDFVRSGVDRIDTTRKEFSIDCDYTNEDTLIVANSQSGFEDLEKEHASFQQLQFQSKLYPKDTLNSIITSDSFYGGMTFGPTFGINVFNYLQTLKTILLDQGVQIYEETPARAVYPTHIETPSGSVKANLIILCTDRFIPHLGFLKKEVFQVQSFLLITPPLEETTIKKIFPDKRFMAWDTDLLYQYYRMTHDNRFMIGGGTYWNAFQTRLNYHASCIYKKLTSYVQKKFPQVSLRFEYQWPGLIGIAKDLQPLFYQDKQYPHIYCISAATGLPWAAALGHYALQHSIDGRRDIDPYFSPDRSYPISNTLQTFIGKRAAFGLSNLIVSKKQY